MGGPGKRAVKRLCVCSEALIITPHRSTTYTDAVYCYRPSSVVCQSVTLVSPAKTAEPIEMPLGLRTRMGPGNHVLDGGVQIPHAKGQFWRVEWHPIVKYRDTVVICTKTAEQIAMPFGLWARMGPRNRVSHGGPVQIPCGKGQFWGK